jgi:L-ribulose-5-phosphate 3-epimerase UlaE
MEGLERSTFWAAQAGVMLGLENLDTPFVDSIAKGLAVTGTINSPWLHLYPDIGNLAAAGYYPPDEVALAKGQLLGLHVKDALPRVIRGVPFGKGIVPFEEAFHALALSGFWGIIGVEMWGNMHLDQDPFTGAAAARTFVDQLVTEAWPAGQPHMAEIRTSFRNR